ncbi:Pbp4 [Kluyveromyces lactis]|nr:Pbp4 [Kluyveromyces lactis]
MANAWQSKKLGAWGSESSALKKKSLAYTTASPTSASAIPTPETSGNTSRSSISSQDSRSNKKKNNNSNGENSQTNQASYVHSKPPFNHDEVKQFLISQFEQYSRSSVTLTTDDSTDWNTSQSKTWKSKKYGCLSELERVLR